ncbi:MAG: cyanoexosortase A [Gomphosphaeria aponina SAG 52.96 = DSM 107014]|uniref:Cyanoexosortase A n=1 Tax=Gomphosphaeria aponina SAG 52.96 = DSM 107014 TaxID=1521640 RepID=A0A941GST8_9CHRO|nr:cyanoexosortase A [Gomphosphaeria aponina SAG 52.96 = DSM 107014]
MDWQEKLQQPKYWLLAIAAALVSLHLTYLARAEDSDVISMSVLLWLAIGSLVWDKVEKGENLKLESGGLSSAIAITLIALVLIRSISPAGYHLRISPFISIWALCLLAGGFQGLGYYWKELVIGSLFLLYPVFASFLQAIDLATFTTKFSTFSLWATGFQVYREGVTIFLPTGRVEVFGACSGIESILQMLNLAVLFLLLVPTNKIQKTICITVAVFLGFAVNAARVSFLAVLVAANHLDAFHYWHGGNGTFIFSIISVFLFGLFCWLTFLRNLSAPADEGET